MTTSALRFRNHEEFHRAAMHMVAAGGLAALIAWAARLGPAAAPVMSPWALTLVAAAAAVAALAPALRREGKQILGRALLVIGGGACLALAPRVGMHTLAPIGFAALFGAALAWGTEGRRLTAAIAGGAVLALVARYCFTSIATARELAGAPGWLSAVLAGAAFSLVTAVALLPRHLEVARDPVSAAYKDLHGALSGEVADLVEGGHRLWAEASASLAEGDIHRRTIEEGTLRLFEVARHWRTDAGAAAPSAAELTERLATLDQRVEATQDPVARDQYRQAREGVAEQLRHLESIGTNRERVLARMHNYLAAMERLRLAVAKLQSANASRTAEEVQPLASDVADLGRDIDACAEAMAEVDERGA